MQRFLNGRIFRTTLALAVVLSLAFSGAGQAGAAQDKLFKLAVASDVTALDPHVQLSEETVAYSHWVFDPLIRWTKDMKFEPRLAESWEQINPTTWRFHLRKGVKFHSGNDLTAQDVAWTLARLKKAPDYKGLFEPFGDAKVVDDNTVDIVTHKPYGLVLNMMTYLFVMDSKFYTGTDENGQPKDAINKTGPSFANLNASGTGPFKVVERQQDVEMTMEAHPQYWGPRGNVKTLRITPIKNDATRVASLLSRASDMIMPVPTQDYERLKKNDQIQLITMNSTRVVTIQMNQETNKALADKRVREAIIRATDNDAIVRTIMRGFTKSATQQLPEDMAGYNPDLKPRYDLERAKQLLKEAGYADGLELNMISPNNRYVNDEKIAMAFVNMMAKAGITVSLKTMPRTQYWDVYDLKEADLSLLGWHPDTEDAGNYTEYLLMCPDTKTGYGQYNALYCNKRVDELALACQTETDAVKRAAMLQEIERIAYDDAAFVPLHFEPHGWAGSLKLKNMGEVVNGMNFPYFGDLVME